MLRIVVTIYLYKSKNEIHNSAIKCATLKVRVIAML
jgi:hypothetical protein